MNNFQYKNPTKILFGKGQIENLSNEIPNDAKVLLLYGGGSIKKNGVYEQVKTALSKVDVIEFGGIPANPEYEVLLSALDIIKEEKVPASETCKLRPSRVSNLSYEIPVSYARQQGFHFLAYQVGCGLN